MQFIFTCQPSSSNIAVGELNKKDNSFEFTKWLDEGIGLANTNLNSNEFANLVKCSPIIFIRHIAKVDNTFNYNQNWKDEVLELAKQFLNKNKTFSIQLRHNKLSFNFSEIISYLSTKIQEQGFCLDVKNSQQIISLFMDTNKIYFGISDVQHNLSKFKSGNPHYREEEDFISRAEFKLTEALDVFNIDLKDVKSAADFGSAPGGWTKVLAKKGINVVSIDPAKLDQSVLSLKNVTHKKMTIQEYFFHHNSVKFDMIVNDMKMDVKKSIELSLNFFDKLNKNGILIMTFKLPKHYNLKFIESNLNILLKKFNLISARQLFYNRSEITVALQKN